LFSDVNVSQGSVATYARCGVIFNNQLAANLPGNLPVKKILKIGSSSYRIMYNCTTTVQRTTTHLQRRLLEEYRSVYFGKLHCPLEAVLESRA